MPDPIHKFISPPVLPELSLFDSTSIEAGRIAHRFAGIRYRQILTILKEAGSDGACIFEVAAAMGKGDHQISGRFGELVQGGAILKTGRRKPTPHSQCNAYVYEITTIGISIANLPTSNAPQTPFEGGVK